jgi:hypothetical protein
MSARKSRGASRVSESDRRVWKQLHKPGGYWSMVPAAALRQPGVGSAELTFIAEVSESDDLNVNALIASISIARGILEEFRVRAKLVAELHRAG